MLAKRSRKASCEQPERLEHPRSHAEAPPPSFPRSSVGMQTGCMPAAVYVPTEDRGNERESGGVHRMRAKVGAESISALHPRSHAEAPPPSFPRSSVRTQTDDV